MSLDDEKLREHKTIFQTDLNYNLTQAVRFFKSSRKMYTPDLATKSDIYDHFVTNKISNVQSTFLPSSNYSDYSDSGPLNIYNNYNPNFHHHHYYYPNFESCHGYQNSIDHNWIRKFDYENQKEYFTANTPSPAEFCDFEIPQQQSNNNFQKTSKLHNEVDKYFFDTSKSSLINKDLLNNNLVEPCKITTLESEKLISTSEVKINQKNSKRCKSPSSSSDLGV